MWNSWCISINSVVAKKIFFYIMKFMYIFHAKLLAVQLFQWKIHNLRISNLLGKNKKGIPNYETHVYISENIVAFADKKTNKKMNKSSCKNANSLCKNIK